MPRMIVFGWNRAIDYISCHIYEPGRVQSGQSGFIESRFLNLMDWDDMGDGPYRIDYTHPDQYALARQAIDNPDDAVARAALVDHIYERCSGTERAIIDRYWWRLVDNSRIGVATMVEGVA